ncbi:unknown [Pasteurella phage F108]|uniref:Uncharacterized protein n=1 Tax=Pasteurella phage F108 TaxID=2911430 RepID=Q1I112_9CAUD|nr:hypothetical protein F108p08 [Pasteurella phage F108]ABD49443.1 unknown [Pasteurella phage F108]
MLAIIAWSVFLTECHKMRKKSFFACASRSNGSSKSRKTTEVFKRFYTRGNEKDRKSISENQKNIEPIAAMHKH